MYQGEHAAHFHALTMAREAGIPPEWRGVVLLGHLDELVRPLRT